MNLHREKVNGDVDVSHPGKLDGRKYLYFTNGLELDYAGKLQWSVKLAKTQRDFEVLFKEGRNRPSITVKNEEAANVLTPGILLELPREREKRT